jgi:hypothetical protein
MNVNGVNGPFDLDKVLGLAGNNKEDDDSSIFSFKNEDDEIKLEDIISEESKSDEVEYSSQRMDLVNALAKTKDANEREKIQNQISALDMQHSVEKEMQEKEQREIEYSEAMLNATSDLEREEISTNYQYQEQRIELKQKFEKTTDSAERQMILDKITKLDKEHQAEQDRISKQKRQQEYDEAMLNASSDIERQELSTNFAYQEQRIELLARYESTSDIAERQAITDKIRALDKQHEAEQNQIQKLKRQQEYDEAMLNASSGLEQREISAKYGHQEQRIELMEKYESTTDPIVRQEIMDRIRQADIDYEIEQSQIGKLKRQQEYDEAMLNASSGLEQREISAKYYHEEQIIELKEKFKATSDHNERQKIMDRIRQADKEYDSEQSQIEKLKRQQEYDEAMLNATSDVERQKLSTEFSYQEQRIELKERYESTTDSATKQYIMDKIAQLDKQHAAEMEQFE